MKSVLAAACLTAAALMPMSVHAQSFNCRYARTADEVLICQDSRLSRLDERMAGLYARLRNSLYGRQRQGLMDGQSAWLQSRYSCGRDAGCIADSYRQRINELEAY